MGFFDNLFGPKTKSTRTPFEKNYDLTQTADQLMAQGEARQRTADRLAAQTGQTVSGLARGDLVDMLAKALSGATGAAQSAAQTGGAAAGEVLDRLRGETAPAGYAAARNELVGDYADAVAGIGHNAGISGRLGGSAPRLQMGDARNQLLVGLANAFDKYRGAADDRILRTAEALPGLQFGAAREAADILARPGVFERVESERQDQTASETQEENALLARILSALETKKGKEWGFGTHVAQGSSLFSQLVDGAKALTGAGSPFGSGGAFGSGGVWEWGKQ